MSQIIAESSSSLQSLATQPTLVETERYYCPFLERGFCRDPSRCNFSHDCHTSTKIPTDYCHFYLANQCLFGQDCKFLHSEPDDDDTLLSNIVDTSSSQNSGLLFAAAGDDDSDDLLYNNENPSQEIHENQVDHDQVYQSSIQDKEVDDRQLPRSDQQSNEFDNESGSNYNDGEPDQRHDNLSHWLVPPNEIEQPSSSSTRLKAIRISHRCAMSAPSTSKTIIAKLRLPANLATQTSGNDSTASTSDNKTKPPDADTTKTSWQGARLIASIRNNLGLGDQDSSGSNTDVDGNVVDEGLKDLPICPYSIASGECPFPEGDCNYLHGLVCDLCYSACLHPYNEEQRHQHREECLREHEQEMELSFAVQRSKDKVCGICMDTVVEKKPITSSRFGILEKCNHTFCLDCIRKWRGTKQFDSRTIRACPECRISSDFVIPSKYWVEDQNDKDRLINDYKAALKSKPCRYFNEGKGDCPFAGSCFYKHAYPDGSLAVMDAPKPRRRLYGARGPRSSVANYILWNILNAVGEDDLSDDQMQSLSDVIGDMEPHELGDLEDDYWSSIDELDM